MEIKVWLEKGETRNTVKVMTELPEEVRNARVRWLSTDESKPLGTVAYHALKEHDCYRKEEFNGYCAARADNNLNSDVCDVTKLWRLAHLNQEYIFMVYTVLGMRFEHNMKIKKCKLTVDVSGF